MATNSRLRARKRLRQQCGRKIGYASSARAKLACDRASKTMNWAFEAYVCEWCGLWHIGHVSAAWDEYHVRDSIRETLRDAEILTG